MTTQRVQLATSSRRGWLGRWWGSRREHRVREREKVNLTSARKDEDAWIERVRSAMLPFVEKGRRNYVVAQLMRPRGTIIW